MRLPQPLLQSTFFAFERLDDFLAALGDDADEIEISEIRRLAGLGLPPVTSHAALGTMLGINAGILQAFERRPEKFYRTFHIPKGRDQRKIQAPKMGLKIIQKWLSVALSKVYNPPDHVFGFVEGRSHLDAAQVHIGARWIFNTDIEKYFESTPKSNVFQALIRLGYGIHGATIISNLACYGGGLSQGSPLSPILSNICFEELDQRLNEIAQEANVKFSRYADDLVFSGINSVQKEVELQVKLEFENWPWQLSLSKTRTLEFPQRLKVHGLLVHGNHLRLTKGYRNRVRALRHLQAHGKLSENVSSARGHLLYAIQVSKRSEAI